MSIFLRVIHTIVTAFFRKKLNITDKASLKMRVWLHEADLKFVNHARFLTYLEMARWDFGIRLGIFSLMKQRKCLPVVAGQTIRYEKSLKRFGHFQVNTQLAGWDDRFFYFEHTIETDGKTVAFSMARLVFRDSQGTLKPDSIFRALKIDVDSSLRIPDEVMKWEETELVLKDKLRLW